MNLAPLHEGASIQEEQSWLARSIEQITMSGVPRDSVRVGRTVYPFRRQLVERIGPAFYSLDGFFPHIVGEGKNSEAARRDFEEKLHVAFQDTARTADFDRTIVQQRLWLLCSSLIDIAAYDQLRTVTVTRIGKVIGSPRAGLIKIRWASGVAQRIDARKAVPEFAALQIGQWFEAVIRTNYLSAKLLSVEHVARIRTPVFTATARSEFWNSVLPPAKQA